MANVGQSRGGSDALVCPWALHLQNSPPCVRALGGLHEHEFEHDDGSNLLSILSWNLTGLGKEDLETLLEHISAEHHWDVLLL